MKSRKRCKGRRLLGRRPVECCYTRSLARSREGLAVSSITTGKYWNSSVRRKDGCSPGVLLADSSSPVKTFCHEAGAVAGKRRWVSPQNWGWLGEFSTTPAFASHFGNATSNHCSSLRRQYAETFSWRIPEAMTSEKSPCKNSLPCWRR